MAQVDEKISGENKVQCGVLRRLITRRGERKRNKSNQNEGNSFAATSCTHHAASKQIINIKWSNNGKIKFERMGDKKQ